MKTRSGLKIKIREYKAEKKGLKVLSYRKHKATANKIKRTNNISTRSLTKRCLSCNKPFILKDKASKRVHCIYCIMKKVGETKRCIACDNEYLSFKGNKKDFCYPCYIGVDGGRRKECKCCGIHFYQSKNSYENKDLCYDCYLKTNGVKAQCQDCNKEIYVMRNDLDWKKRCSDCYIHDYIHISK